MHRIVTFLALLSATALAQSRPNIIFFLVDDLGCFWQDQRASSKKFDTPALDRMAAEGAKLTHHYVAASVGAPSRASLLQGRADSLPPSLPAPGFCACVFHQKGTPPWMPAGLVQGR